MIRSHVTARYNFDNRSIEITVFEQRDEHMTAGEQSLEITPAAARHLAAQLARVVNALEALENANLELAKVSAVYGETKLAVTLDGKANDQKETR